MLDPQSLESLADGFERQWRIVSEGLPTVWAALVALKLRRLESFGVDPQSRGSA
jgi:hypothetical protein